MIHVVPRLNFTVRYHCIVSSQFSGSLQFLFLATIKMLIPKPPEWLIVRQKVHFEHKFLHQGGSIKISTARVRKKSNSLIPKPPEMKDGGQKVHLEHKSIYQGKCKGTTKVHLQALSLRVITLMLKEESLPLLFYNEYKTDGDCIWSR